MVPFLLGSKNELLVKIKRGTMSQFFENLLKVLTSSEEHKTIQMSS